jgi:hypothetical protein
MSLKIGGFNPASSVIPADGPPQQPSVQAPAAQTPDASSAVAAKLRDGMARGADLRAQLLARTAAPRAETVTKIDAAAVQSALKRPNQSIYPARAWDASAKQWRETTPADLQNPKFHQIPLTDGQGRLTAVGAQLAKATGGTHYVVERGANYTDFVKLTQEMNAAQRAAALAWAQSSGAFGNVGSGSAAYYGATRTQVISLEEMIHEGSAELRRQEVGKEVTGVAEAMTYHFVKGQISGAVMLATSGTLNPVTGGGVTGQVLNGAAAGYAGAASGTLLDRRELPNEEETVYSTALGGAFGALGALPGPGGEMTSVLRAPPPVRPPGPNATAEAVTNEGWRVRMAAQDSPPVGAPERTPPVSNQNIQSRANGFPNQRIPAADGQWTGEVGNSGWMSSKPEVRAITKGEPVPFKDGYPDFSKWKVGEVQLETVTGIDSVDRAAANKVFAEQRGWLKPNGKPNAAASEKYRKDNNLTWHHVQNSNRLELVPKPLNRNIPHSGSASQARNGELP